MDEIAERIDLPEDKINDALKANSRHVSMDAPIGDGEDSSMMDFYASSDAASTDNQLDLESLHKEIERVLETLDERDRKLIDKVW